MFHKKNGVDMAMHSSKLHPQLSAAMLGPTKHSLTRARVHHFLCGSVFEILGRPDGLEDISCWSRGKYDGCLEKKKHGLGSESLSGCIVPS
jgi:hypothetical protein